MYNQHKQKAANPEEGRKKAAGLNEGIGRDAVGKKRMDKPPEAPEVDTKAENSENNMKITTLQRKSNPSVTSSKQNKKQRHEEQGSHF